MYTVCPDYSKNLLLALEQKWPFLSQELAGNQIGCLQSTGTWRVTMLSTLERAVAIAIGLQLFTSAGSLDLRFCIADDHYVHKDTR